MSEREKSRATEMAVITEAKDLCAYVMKITQKSPKQFRFTFVSRMQNLALNVIENIYRANEVFILSINMKERLDKRLGFQHSALTELKLLAYFASVSVENNCILLKHFEQISKRTTKCQRLLGAWINSDRKRFDQSS